MSVFIIICWAADILKYIPIVSSAKPTSEKTEIQEQSKTSEETVNQKYKQNNVREDGKPEKFRSISEYYDDGK